MTIRYINHVELFQRKVDLAEYGYPLGVQDVFGPESFGYLARALIGRCAQEKFIIIMYNSDRCIIGYSEINKGHDIKVDIDIMSTLRTAIMTGAKYIALAHNHPMGELLPSQADIDTTLRIIRASNMLEIETTDHVIVNSDRYFSIRTKIGELSWQMALNVLF